MSRGLLFFSCLLILASFRQVKDPNQIDYSPEYFLKWTDFRMVPDAASKHAAFTHTGMSMDMSTTDNKTLIFTIKSYFRKEKSWVKETSKSNMELLKHEQLHFDIYECHAREFRKKLSESKLKMSEIQKKLPEMYNKQIADCKAEQELYDKETNHSLNKADQQRWNVKIATRLKNSILWKEQKVTISPLP